jgi:hypothetical protein
MLDFAILSLLDSVCMHPFLRAKNEGVAKTINCGEKKSGVMPTKKTLKPLLMLYG